MSAFLSLGSNIGDRKYHLETAIMRLTQHPQIALKKESGIYETEPWGEQDQPAFWNQVIEVKTTLSPHELLNYCQEIEKELGRVRIKHWGPRTIDIDIILYNNRVIEDEHLTIPHPYMEEREFVLTPLREIAPDLILPSGKKISDITGLGQTTRI